MALATIADYEAITGTAVPDAPSPERDRIERLLELGSSAVLAGAYGQNIAEATYADTTLNVSDGYGYFPQRPVSNVATVTCNGATLTAGTDYRWTPGGNRQPAYLIRIENGRDSYWPADAQLAATYTAGWNPVPGQVIAMNVAMASSTIATGGAAPASSRSETLGGHSEAETYDTAEARQANYALTPSDQATLNRLCGLRSPASARTVRDQP
jgi:hypothetical protein